MLVNELLEIVIKWTTHSNGTVSTVATNTRLRYLKERRVIASSVTFNLASNK